MAISAGAMAEAALNDPRGEGRTWISLAELLALRSKPLVSPFHFGGDTRTGPARIAPLRARGMEFDDVRAWQPGDDPRHMHWKATARTGRPYTKLYQEESERPTVLCVDLTHRMHFATTGAFKAVIAARVTMMIAWAAVAARDRVSGLVISSAGLTVTPPLPGRRGGQRLARALAEVFQTDTGAAAGGKPELAEAVPLLQRHAPSGSRLVLVSDFLGDGDLGALRQLAARRPLLTVRIHDPLDRDLPPPGRYAVRDGRGGLVFESGDPAARRRWSEAFAETTRALAEIARDCGGACMQFRTGQDPAASRNVGPGKVLKLRSASQRRAR